MKLKISDSLSLPLDAITETFAVMGIRGSGKTHTASVMAEEMLKNQQPIVVYDPTGAWFGLKTSADGRHPGFPVVVFGGEHADVPLEETAGATIANVIVEKRFPAILDVSLLRKGSRIRFMQDFCEALYHRNREALHFFVDEVHTIAPQRAFPEMTRVLGAMEDIVLQGRRRGIGLTVISQRPALVNTNIRTQCSTLIAMRIVGPHDRKAVEEWTEAHGTPERTKEMMGTLATLAKGEGWVWSVWLDMFKRVRFRQRETFDSSATPEVGKRAISPKVCAEIDLAALGKQIEETVEKAKADDPRELRRKVADLERQLKARPSQIQERVVETIVEVPVLKNGQLDKALLLRDRLQAVVEPLVQAIAGATKPVQAPPSRAQPISPARRNLPKPLPSPSRASSPPQNDSGEIILSRVQQRILDALAWYESLGNTEPTVIQVGAVALIDASGGYFSNVAGPLSASGLVERGVGTMRLTDAGRAMASPIENPGTLGEYHDVLRARVRRMKSACGKTIDILGAVIAAGGQSVSVEEIGAAVGLDHTGGYFSNCIGPLATVGLIERRAGVVRPTDVLFPPGLE